MEQQDTEGKPDFTKEIARNVAELKENFPT
jgi:aldehyde dehydrogenase (NAD+)